MTTREQMHIGDMSHETAIGILKLMLEAMETYDGISPTPERINAVKTVIEALEQEPIIDKIRAEIENHCGLVKENHCKYCSYCNSVMGVREILEIINKYKAESEGE